MTNEGDLEEGQNGGSVVPTDQTSVELNQEIVKEPYLTVEEIAHLHPQSHVDLSNIEHSRGLDSKEAVRRLSVYGKNILTPPPKMPEWKRFLKQYSNTFLVLLNTCAALSLLAFILSRDMTNLYLAIVLVVVVFLTAFLQFHEEGKAYAIVDSFKHMLATTCNVIRDGRHRNIDVELVVPGDLIVLRNGDKVSADVVLLLCRDLKTERASLTGESEPLAGTDEPSKVDTPLFECKNVAFNGSLCFDGMAIGLVLKTGDLTAIGTIAKLASDTQLQDSTLQREVKKFVKVIAFVSIAMATVCFVASIFLRHAKTAEDVIKLFVNGFLVIIVANVPQGLPATVTSLLSLAARNMAKHSVLVKRIDCVETLGSTSIICSDKTGTLTKNEMTVTDVWYSQRLIKRYHRQRAKSLHSQEPQAVLYRTAVLCNRGEPTSEESQSERQQEILSQQIQQISNVSRLSWGVSVQKSILSISSEQEMGPKFAGNPSDVALLSFCDKVCSVQALRTAYPIVFEVPFNSTNKWQLVIVKSVGIVVGGMDGDIEYEVLMKGAPEVILQRCSTYSSLSAEDHQAPITDEFREEFQETYQKFASQGRRVLALCSRTFQAEQNVTFAANEENEYNFPTTGLNFVGLIAIMDPPRDNVPEAIAKCQSAGVKVFMVTGDHPLTAMAIAKQIGLLKSDNNLELLEESSNGGDNWDSYEGAVVHGSCIDGLTDEQWSTILSKDGVCFTRTTPAHKLEIVRRCQLMGNIVAVTGDGVNDSPALKQADVGIAMGLKGSAVAQEVADILLMDDNFASIVDGIQEGRIIFDNIKKTIAYTMAHIFPEVVSALLNLLGGLPAGLTAMQVLTIDLGTELGPAISLAYEKSEANIMDRPPRDPKRDRLVSPSLLFYSYVTSGAIITLACMVAYTFIYKVQDILLSDFHKPDLNAPGEDFFSLTAANPVVVQRTGETFSPGEQQNIFSQAATAFYITLTCAQFCHIWVCKTRVNSIFTHGCDNKLTFYGVAVGLALAIFFSYVPGVQNFVGSAMVGWIPWVCAPAGGALLWIYNESAKWYFRHAGDSNILVRMFAW